MLAVRHILLCASLGLCLFSCMNDDATEPELILAGGQTTIFSNGPDAYTFPLANLDSTGIKQHFIADGIFGQQFVSAPAIQFGGLGPLFNQNSCESCHIRNGRGNIPQYNGDPNSGLLLRLSIPGQGSHGAILPVPGFGGQLQNKALFGVVAEGKIYKSDISEIVKFLDGESITLVQPKYSIAEPYQALHPLTMISPRNAPPVFGLGLLEAISDTDILKLEDISDIDKNGISGKANIVWDVLNQRPSLGRFGWKAEQPTTGQQAADAAHNDMGLTSYYFPTEQCISQSNCTQGVQNEWDTSKDVTDMFAYYFQTLAVPAQRDQTNGLVQKGQDLFQKMDCASCHTPKHVTASHVISALSFQTIYPYTDLLLHDMGDGLSDHRPTYLAEGNEWRTPPLWGIGLTQIVNPKATFLHDGRAKTIEEAILWHGGEAEESKEKFRKSAKVDRDALIAFLKSL